MKTVAVLVSSLLVVALLSVSLAHKKAPAEISKHQAPTNFSPQPTASVEPAKAASSAAEVSAPPTVPAVTLDEYQSTMRPLDSAALQEIVNSVETQVKAEHWIDRANSNLLSPNQLQEFASLLNKRAAANSLLIEQDLARIESEI